MTNEKTNPMPYRAAEAAAVAFQRQASAAEEPAVVAAVPLPDRRMKI